MNLQMIWAAAGALLVSLSWPGPGIRATSRTGGTIVATGQMTAARFDHAAVLLSTGRVLIVGGIERNGVMQPSAELFDPATGHFKATGKPLVQHGWGVTATLLQNGKVLVTGGSTGCDSPVLRRPRNFMIRPPGRLHPRAK